MAPKRKRVEINESVAGARARASRTSGVSVAIAPKKGVTLNTKHGARVSKTFKGLTLGFQNFNSVVRGRWNAGGMNVNLSKSGLSVSNKNALGTFNFKKPKSSSATVGGIQVRGQAGAAIAFVGMVVSALVGLAKVIAVLAVPVCLIFAWLGQLVWNVILLLFAFLIFAAFDVPRQFLFGTSEKTFEPSNERQDQDTELAAGHIALDSAVDTELRSKSRTPAKQEPNVVASYERMRNEFLQDSSEDYLGEAALLGHEAKAAIKDKKYDKAFKLYQSQKELYLHHANRQGFTTQQTFSLDASVHENLANILRLEHKNDDALAHILYWVIAQKERPIKRHSQKLAAYFNRCNFSNVLIEEAINFSALDISKPDYRTAQIKVAEWRSRG